MPQFSINVGDADARELSIFTDPIVKRGRRVKANDNPPPEQGPMTRQQRRQAARKAQKRR